MTEHDTQSAILDLIRLRGGVVTRINSGSAVFKRNGVTNVIRGAEKGTSDIIALYKGVYLAIEVKFGKGKPTPEQLSFLDSVAKAGGVGLVAYDISWVATIMDLIDENGINFVMTDKFDKPNRLFVEVK